MTRGMKAARDGGVGTVVAGRSGESARGGGPCGAYHSGLAAARPELLRVATPQGPRVAGAFVRCGDEVAFVKVGDAAAHKLRWPVPAWALAVEALEEVARRGVERIVIRDRQAGVWFAWFTDFERHGVPLDRGYGEQVALACDWWSFAPHGSVTAERFGGAGR